MRVMWVMCQSRNASRPVKVSPCLIFSSFIFLFEVQAKTLSIWSCFDHFGQPLRHLRFARCFVLGVVEQQCQDKGMNAMNSMQNGRKQQNQRYSDNLGSNRAYPGSRRIQGELHFRAAQMFAKLQFLLIQLHKIDAARRPAGLAGRSDGGDRTTR